ncbi:hypothetical protein C0992_012457 [Termitomyces sp. T32_za158]|nr:hypothetical protein C0992_012457 [Termitomyces sp. T32_za158]
MVIKSGPLQPVSNLLNYIIQTSHFPDSVKPIYISTIHKKGNPTLLSNYRSIACSNVLCNMPFAWLNSKLGPYLNKHSIIPPFQIATKPGVQACDIIYVIAQVQKWAHRTRTPLYILQQDQKKGFDMLEPQGFNDAIHAYGLPSLIIDLDSSLQHLVPYQVKTAYGFTEPFTVNGITKQGGSLSPIKCALTTSLASRWLEDLQSQRRGEILLHTMSSRTNSPHTNSDFLSTKITMIEAMDNSLIMNSSLATLLTLAEHADRFQATYGWKTEWKKSSVYAYNSPLYPNLSSAPTILVPSVNPRNPQQLQLHKNLVLVVTSHTTFLRILIDQPDLHFATLRDIMMTFDFPLLHKRLPITALHRIVTQGLISKLRPRLALQPLSPKHASRLDTLLADKIHCYLGFPFRFPTHILFLPVSDRGFGFPSVSALNNALAVAGLHRDLNHHQPAFKSIAAISIADWTCQYNSCNDPLQLPGLHYVHACQYKFLPHAWITAQEALRQLRLYLIHTDVSDILIVQVALLHLFRALKFLCPDHDAYLKLTNSFFNSCSQIRCHNLFNVGQWVYGNPDMLPTAFLPIPCPIVATPSMFIHWPTLQSWLCDLPMLIQKFSFPDPGLLIPHPLQQQLSENLIFNLANNASMPLSCQFPEGLYASDASLISSAHKPSVTCAVINGRNAFVGSLRHFLSSASILCGEAYAIVVAHILVMHTEMHSPQSSTLYSDHLSSVHFVNSPSFSPLSLTQQPCCSLYRWLQSLSSRIHDKRKALHIQHIKAHTSTTSLPAQMNQMVDWLATSSQTSRVPPPSLLVPTFFLDDYTLFSIAHGWIESNTTHFVQNLCYDSLITATTSRQPLHLNPLLYDANGIPPYLYLNASSAFSIVVQLYIRSHQLDTRKCLSTRLSNSGNPFCRMGCIAVEDIHHVFVSCPHFDHFRAEAITTVLNGTRKIMTTHIIPDHLHAHVLEGAAGLFSDGSVWPLGISYYYYGPLPPSNHRSALGARWGLLALRSRRGLTICMAPYPRFH